MTTVTNEIPYHFEIAVKPEGCCQSNANLSPANIAGAGGVYPQAAMLLHSANAVERRSL